MAYPEKVLADDEQVVEHLHPHWITLVPATLWFLVICAAGGRRDRLRAQHRGTTQQALIIAIIVVGAVLLCWLTFAPVDPLAHHALRVHHPPGADPPRRASSRRPRHRPAAHQRRRLLAVAVGPDRRAGTLTIESAGEHGQETLNNIPHSDQAPADAEPADRAGRRAAGVRRRARLPAAGTGLPAAAGLPAAGLSEPTPRLPAVPADLSLPAAVDARAKTSAGVGVRQGPNMTDPRRTGVSPGICHRGPRRSGVASRTLFSWESDH